MMECTIAEPVIVLEAENVMMDDAVFEYKEQTEWSGILKKEWFDEDTIKSLLNDTRFSKQDRTHLSSYNRHRTSGSQMNTEYVFGAGCEECRLGRLYAQDGLSLQSFRFDIRNPLAQKWYWDTDITNAHYIIALKWARDYHLKCDRILDYIENREERLKMVSAKRSKAKTEFLKCLYLGDIKLYSSQFNEMDGDITEEGYQYLTLLKKEVETLALTIWDKFPQYHKLKIGKDKKMLKNKHNPKASLMSLLFQTEERKMLMIWDAFLTFRGRFLSVFIHDGGYVRKLEGETYFPPELLVEGAKEINRFTGYNVKLEQKEIKFDWTPLKPDQDIYKRMKAEFEKHSFLLSHQVVSVLGSGKLEYLKVSEAKIKFAPLKFSEWSLEKNKIVEVSFLERWIDDKDRTFYENVGFYPEPSLCPAKTYNLFKGFNAEKYRPDTEEELDIPTLIAPIINHFDLLTSGHSAWLMRYFAKIVQFPHLKSDLAILNRDESKFLVEGGGTGKNLGYEWFGNEILGEEYFIVVGDNDILYGNFNSQFENKLLVFVEEAEGSCNFKSQDKLKSKITGRKINVNKKNVAQYDLDDFASYIFATNNRNPLPIKSGDRRWAVFDVNPEKRGNVEYFENLVAEMARPEVKWAFYQYLKGLDTIKSSALWAKSVPFTPAYREIRELNTAVHLKWIVEKLENGELENGLKMYEYYNDFKMWAVNSKFKSGNEIITMTAFGRLLVQEEATENNLSADQFGTKKKSHGCMIMKWNYDKLITGLKALHLLDPDFVYQVAEEVQEEENDAI